MPSIITSSQRQKAIEAERAELERYHICLKNELWSILTFLDRSMDEQTDIVQNIENLTEELHTWMLKHIIATRQEKEER